MITVGDASGLHGCTATAWAEAADPPLLLITLRNTSLTLRRILASGWFAVNVLEAAQEDLARQFAGPGDRFANVAFELGGHGQPLIHHALASMECAVEATFPFGAYRIVTGQVASVRERESARPLVFSAGKFFAGPTTT